MFVAKAWAIAHPLGIYEDLGKKFQSRGKKNKGKPAKTNFTGSPYGG